MALKSSELIQQVKECRTDEERQAICQGIIKTIANNHEKQQEFSKTDSFAAVLNIASECTTDAARKYSVIAIIRITRNNLEWKRVFSTSKVVSVLLKMANECSNNELKQDIALAIKILINQTKNKRKWGTKLFSIPNIISFLIKKANQCRDDAERVNVVNVIGKLISSEYKAAFLTPEIGNAVGDMASQCEDDTSIVIISRKILAITHQYLAGKYAFSTITVAIALREMARKCQTDAARSILAQVIISITHLNLRGQQELSEPDLFSAIIRMANESSSPAIRKDIFDALFNLIFENKKGQRVLLTSKEFSSFIQIFSEFNTSAKWLYIIKLIGTIDLNDEERQTLTPELVSALITTTEEWGTDKTRECCAGAIVKFTDGNPDGQRAFSKPEPVHALIKMAKYCAADAARANIALAMANIACHPEGQQALSTPGCLTVLIRMAEGCRTVVSRRNIVKALNNIGTESFVQAAEKIQDAYLINEKGRFFAPRAASSQAAGSSDVTQPALTK